MGKRCDSCSQDKPPCRKRTLLFSEDRQSVHPPSPDREWQKQLEVESKKGDFVETKSTGRPRRATRALPRGARFVNLAHLARQSHRAPRVACSFHMSNPGKRLVACICDVVGGRVVEPRKVVLEGRELQFVVSFTLVLVPVPHNDSMDHQASSRASRRSGWSARRAGPRGARLGNLQTYLFGPGVSGVVIR